MKITLKQRFGFSLLVIIILTAFSIMLSGCAFPGIAKPTATPTATLEPSLTPTITNTPEPTATLTPAESPTPTMTATPIIQYVITLGTLFEKHCNLFLQNGILVIDTACEDIKLDKFPIKRGEKVWFSIFIAGDESTYTETSNTGWVKLQAGELSEVDTRGRMFSCSPPGFGEFICVVNIESPNGIIPLNLNIQAALE